MNKNCITSGSPLGKGETGGCKTRNYTPRPDKSGHTSAKGNFQVKLASLAGLLAASFLLLGGCSESKNPSSANQCVSDPYPLAVGNYWDYTIEQSISVAQADSTLPPVTASASGSQHVTVIRTETITGDEAFGTRHEHIMGRMFDFGVEDTTVEIHYFASRPDAVILKAKQTQANSTGGFIPLALTPGSERLGAQVKVAGKTSFIPLERLARMLLDPSGWSLPLPGISGPALSSDGVENEPDVIFYPRDYVLVYQDLCKGRNWVSEEAQEVGGVEVSQKVTNIIDELNGFSGPIAEVELSNTFISATNSEELKIRYYYKGGVGIIQAEIYDPQILIVIQLPDGSYNFLGVGAWSVVKKLTAYKVGG